MTVAADRMRSRRQAFAAPGSSLDVIVRLLAVGLPALVGVVAAMMLITPLSPRGEISFLLDRNKVAIAEDRLRVDDAMYRGQDDRGRPFSLVAGEALQRTAAVEVVELNRLTARLALPDGPATLSAPQGSYDIVERQVGIPGTVRFTAADGYQLAARDVTLDLSRRLLTGSGRISGVIPAGRFQADSVRVDLEERTITLRGNARMTMVPGRLSVPRGLEF